jgi:hypothetical protein
LTGTPDTPADIAPGGGQSCVIAFTPTAAFALTDVLPTFGSFVTGSAAVPDSPGVNRVFVTFTDANRVPRGETSVAVGTRQPARRHTARLRAWVSRWRRMRSVS